MQWLTDVLFNAPAADEQPAFVIQNPEVLGLFGWEQGERKYFSFTELSPFLKQIDEQGEQSEKLQSAERSAYQNAIINLRNALHPLSAAQEQRAARRTRKTSRRNSRPSPPRCRTRRQGGARSARRARRSTRQSSMRWRKRFGATTRCRRDGIHPRRPAGRRDEHLAFDRRQFAANSRRGRDPSSREAVRPDRRRASRG